MNALVLPRRASAALLAAVMTTATAAAPPAATAPPMSEAPAAEPVVTHITWLSSDPPSRGAVVEAGGVTAGLITYLQKQAPDVRHEVVLANAKRTLQMLESGEPVCRANMVRNAEREKIAYFTNTQLTPPPQLIVRRDKLSQLPRNPAGEVRLPQLLADPRLRGALMDGRSYGPALDELLARRPADARVTVYSPRDTGGRLLQMVSRDRADYSIDLDMALIMNGDPKDLVSVPIMGASDLVMAGIACARTPWGLSAIRLLDRAFGRPEGAARLRTGLMRWLTPETRAHYAAQFDAFYRERARPSRIDP